MATVLYIGAMILNFSGIAFAAVYIWLNVFSKITDLTARNQTTLKITRTAVVLTLVFGLLSCLLSASGGIGEAVARASQLYAVMAISWLVVLLLCGCAMVVALVSKKIFKPERTGSVKKIFTVALWGTILGTVFAWLFS